MRSFLLPVLVLAFGCAAPEEPAPPAPVEAPAPTAEPSFAGEWDLDALTATEDSVLVSLRLLATDGPTDWALVFDHLNEPVPANAVTLAGDSATVTFGPFASALREGVTVSLMTARLAVGTGGLSGTFQADYEDGRTARGRLRGRR